MAVIFALRVLSLFIADFQLQGVDVLGLKERLVYAISSYNRVFLSEFDGFCANSTLQFYANREKRSVLVHIADICADFVFNFVRILSFWAVRNQAYLGAALAITCLFASTKYVLFTYKWILSSTIVVLSFHTNQLLVDEYYAKYPGVIQIHLWLSSMLLQLLLAAVFCLTSESVLILTTLMSSFIIGPLLVLLAPLIISVQDHLYMMPVMVSLVPAWHIGWRCLGIRVWTRLRAFYTSFGNLSAFILLHVVTWFQYATLLLFLAWYGLHVLYVVSGDRRSRFHRTPKSLQVLVMFGGVKALAFGVIYGLPSLRWFIIYIAAYTCDTLWSCVATGFACGLIYCYIQQMQGSCSHQDLAAVTGLFVLTALAADLRGLPPEIRGVRLCQNMTLMALFFLNHLHTLAVSKKIMPTILQSFGHLDVAAISLGLNLGIAALSGTALWHQTAGSSLRAITWCIVCCDLIAKGLLSAAITLHWMVQPYEVNSIYKPCRVFWLTCWAWMAVASHVLANLLLVAVAITLPYAAQNQQDVLLLAINFATHAIFYKFRTDLAMYRGHRKLQAIGLMARKEVSSNDMCPICHDELDVERDVRVTPCNHEFHAECLQRWCTVGEWCPVCRANLHTGEMNLVERICAMFALDETDE